MTLENQFRMQDSLEELELFGHADVVQTFTPFGEEDMVGKTVYLLSVAQVVKEEKFIFMTEFGRLVSPIFETVGTAQEWRKKNGWEWTEKTANEIRQKISHRKFHEREKNIRARLIYLLTR